MIVSELPDIIEGILPNKNASIWEIIHYELPPVALQLVDVPLVPSAALESSSISPSIDYLSFTTQPTAPDGFCYELQSLLREPDTGEHKSLKIPWFPEELGRVGLWIMEYWDRVRYLRWVQDRWKPRLGWLVKQRALDTEIPNALGVYDKAVKCLKYLHPGEKLAFRGSPQRGEDLEDVAGRLLSNEWLSDSTINHLIDVLQFRVKANSSADKPIPFVLPPSVQISFSGALQSSRLSEQEYKPPKSASQLEAWMEEEGGRTLLFVLNINDSHWVAGCADLVEQHIQIGDSLGGFPDVHDALEPLQTWFHHIFGQTFPVEFTMPTGQQTDGSCCGLFSVNALAMCALGDAPLAHQARNLARASGFLEIARLHLAANKRPNGLGPSVVPQDSRNNIVDISDGSDNEELTGRADYIELSSECESEDEDEPEGEQADKLEGKLGGELESKFSHENVERDSKSGDKRHHNENLSTDGDSAEGGTYGGFRRVNVPNVVVGMVMGIGGLTQLLAGMWEFAEGNSLGATGFSCHGGIWISCGIINWCAGLVANQLNDALGIHFLVWFIVALVIFLAYGLRAQSAKFVRANRESSCYASGARK
ncbi:hypothetical protein FRC10_008004 [Ceratobasidium sp. 414]|nr:hypothetical protein FRC10_008004 [Ceratobasidium sp. 414]